MFKVKNIIILLLFVNPIIGQNLIKNVKLLDSLNFYLFPINTDTELNDTLNNINRNNNTIIIGRKNRPNLMKANSFLKEMRIQKDSKKFNELLRIYNAYEQFFRNEWGKDIGQYFNHQEFLFFMEFEKTLYTLNLELDFKNNKDRYNFLKDNIFSFIKNNNRNAVFSSKYFNTYGSKSIDREYTYLIEQANNLGQNIFEDIKSFKYSNEKKLVVEDIFYFKYLVQALANVDNVNGIDEMLINRYEHFLKLEILHFYVETLIKRGNEKGVKFLINKLFFGTKKEKKLLGNLTYWITMDSDITLKAVTILIDLANEIQLSDVKKYRSMIEYLRFLPHRNTVDFLKVVIQANTSNSELAKESLLYLHQFVKDKELKKYIGTN